MNRINRNILPNYLPYASANIKGSKEYNNIKGKVKFYSWKNGSIIKIELEGLPNKNKNNYFGFHIHESNKCKEIENDKPFMDAGSHLNTENDKHPNHIGDMPSIYSNDGYAYMEFYTNRFKPEEVVGKTIIIHKDKDDFMTDPAGNSGDRIACGEIVRLI